MPEQGVCGREGGVMTAPTSAFAIQHVDNDGIDN